MVREILKQRVARWSDRRRRKAGLDRFGAVERCLGGLSAPLVLWLAVGSLVAIFVIFALNLQASRADVAEAARAASSNLAGAVGQQIAREMELLDLSLLDVQDGARTAELFDLAPKLQQMILFDRAATAHGMGTLMLLDKEGRLLRQAGSPKPMPIDFSSASFFQVQASRSDAGLYVGRLFASLTDGEPSIALSRRVDRDGVFLGVAVATIKTSYFRDLFATLDTGRDGTIALLSDDGQIIMRRPFAADAMGRQSIRSPLVQQMVVQRAGAVEGVSPIDGIRRVYSFDRIGDLPLIVVIGRSVADIYASWWRRAAVTGIVLLILGALMLLLIAALQIALRRRAAAEAELAALARSDKLTGLANRRKFDESLEAEWRRASREGQLLGLILLDVDLFKALNDVFGHQGGDRVLSSVGQCLARVQQRPGDLVARYGGEEFAILLPGATEADALGTARHVEDEIRRLRQPHPRSPTGTLTVSIGVATLRPHSGTTATDLVSFADGALYEAKRTGRNKVVVWADKWAA